MVLFVLIGRAKVSLLARPALFRSVQLVPNITNISYGRGVGYAIEEIVLPEEIQKISATNIRAKMKEVAKDVIQATANQPLD